MYRSKHNQPLCFPQKFTTRCRNLFSAAIEQYNSGQYRKALTLCDSLYLINASHIDNLILLGAIHLQLGNISESLFYNQQCLKIDHLCPEAYSNIGNGLKELGDLDSALNSYREAIRIQPRFADVYCNHAATQFQQGDYGGAIESFLTAIALHPKHVDGFCNLGNAYKAVGRMGDAKKAYLEAIRINPQCAIAWSNLGGIFEDCKDYDSAKKSYQQALALYPDFSDAYSNLGNTLMKQGLVSSDRTLMQAANAKYKKAIQLRPDFAQANGNLTVCYYYEGKQERGFDQAIALLNRSGKLEIDNADLLNNIGNMHLEKGNVDCAIKCLMRAIDLKPHHSHAYNNLGNCLLRKGSIQAALHCYIASMQSKINFPKAILNLSSLLESQGLLIDSVGHFKEIIEQHPSLTEANFHLANAYKKVGRYEAAIKCYRSVMKSCPEILETYFNLASTLEKVGRTNEAIDLYRQTGTNYGLANAYYLMAKSCDWSLYDNDRECMALLLNRARRQTDAYIQPKHAQILHDVSPIQNLQISQTFSNWTKTRVNTFSKIIDFPQHPYNQGKIRVGYVSKARENHLVDSLIQSLHKFHDKDTFDLFFYSTKKIVHIKTSSFLNPRKAHWHDISALSLTEVASRIYRDKIHILVYLDGYITDELHEVFALHPTRLQINMIGQCCPMGGLFDYIIGDKEVIGNNECFTERIIFQEGSFILADYKQSSLYDIDEDVDPLLLRSQCQISDDAFVYACLDQPSKIDPILFSVWMEILRHTDRSVLVLVRYNDKMVYHLKEKAKDLRIDPDRIIFLDVVTIEEHLRRLRIVDLVLDTMISNGLVSSCDALWAGVPMITIVGDHMYNKIGTSLLKCVGLDDLVTKSMEEYQKLAILLNQDEKKYIEVIRKLEKKRATSDLFNALEWVKGFENSLRKAVELDSLGQLPQHILPTPKMALQGV